MHLYFLIRKFDYSIFLSTKIMHHNKNLARKNKIQATFTIEITYYLSHHILFLEIQITKGSSHHASTINRKQLFQIHNIYKTIEATFGPLRSLKVKLQVSFGSFIVHCLCADFGIFLCLNCV